MQRSNKGDSNVSSCIDLETTSSSSSSSSNSVAGDMDSIEIPETDLSGDDESTETDYDEKISAKERAIREVDLYLTKLQDRRKQLVDECNKLKDEKALRQSNKLAKQNWDSGEYIKNVTTETFIGVLSIFLYCVSDAFPWNAEIQSTLKNVFKLTTFRPQQLKCCNAIMSKHDVLLIAPTGGGKSLCYQLPVRIQNYSG